MNSVLIVDDEEEVRESVARVLARADYEVQTADDGDAGLEAFRKSPADVVITDIIMPEMNGIEFINALRKEYPKVRIIGISGGGDVGHLSYQPNAVSTSAYLAAAEEAGADIVLTKPFEREDLVQAVARMCNP